MTERQYYEQARDSAKSLWTYLEDLKKEQRQLQDRMVTNPLAHVQRLAQVNSELATAQAEHKRLKNLSRELSKRVQVL